MASLDELKQARLRKLELLKKAGMDPYPAKVPRDHCLQDAHKKFAEYEKSEATVNLAGRVMAIRGQGAIQFFVLDDGKATFQAVVKKDVLEPALFELINGAVDIGDIISVTGTMFKTQKGEESILVKGWTMASKSLLPLPEKWHGLVDPDEKLRKRYLDFIMEPELRDLFKKKAKFWDTIREILKAEGFLEVETPTLEITTGGAEARPFTTHHNDYDLDVHLRISVGELWQKRLLAAGFPRVFEIGRLYRNEGSSPEHAQEFTNLEFYCSYMDMDGGIAFTEKMIKEVAKETFGTLSFDTRGVKLDLSGDVWPRIDYVETVEKMAGINVLKASEKDMEKKLKELHVDYDGNNRERLMDTLWKYCRKQIVGPAWLVNVPKLVSPLSKANPKNPETTLRAQLILAGAEMTNGFAELNDPTDQRERFDVQKKLIAAGDKEAMMPDEEFVEMLEHAMPPAFGFGMGERLFATLAGKPLRETQLFPLMRPLNNQTNKKENMYGAAVLNTGAKMEKWQELNTVAHLNAALGARTGKKLFHQDTIATKDDKSINLNIKHAIMIKTASKNADLHKLVEAAKADGLEVSEFTREMITTTNDKKVISETKTKDYSDIEYLGVMVFGPKDAVDGLTKKFELYS